MTEKFPFHCECAYVHCVERIELSIDEYKTIRDDSGLVMIADNCNRPLEDDTLIEERQGYKLYREAVK